MVRVAVNEMTTYRWSFEEDVQHYLSAGYQGIGIWRQKLADYGEEKGRELLEESGLLVSSLQWAGGFTGGDGRAYAESINDAKNALQLGAALQSPCVICYTGPRAGHTRNHARRLVKGALAELAPLAEELGIVLALEPVHAGCAGEWSILTELEETIALMNELGSPAIQLTYDTYHLCQQENQLHHCPDIASRIALVQVGDAKGAPVGEQDRCPLGAGQVPWAEATLALVEQGYQGFVEVELLGQNFESTDYHQTLLDARQAIDQLFLRTNAS